MMDKIRYHTLTKEYATQKGAALVALGADMEWENWQVTNLLGDRPGKWELSWLAESGPQSVGYLVASRPDDSTVHVHHLMVGREWRGRGVGLELLRRLAAQAKPLGIQRLVLKVYRSNEGAVRFYRRHGFEAQPAPNPELWFMAAPLEALCV